VDPPQRWRVRGSGWEGVSTIRFQDAFQFGSPVTGERRRRMARRHSGIMAYDFTPGCAMDRRGDIEDRPCCEMDTIPSPAPMSSGSDAERDEAGGGCTRLGPKRPKERQGCLGCSGRDDHSV
jgi:hypothetical protein